MEKKGETIILIGTYKIFFKKHDEYFKELWDKFKRPNLRIEGGEEAEVNDQRSIM